MPWRGRSCARGHLAWESGHQRRRQQTGGYPLWVTALPVNSRGWLQPEPHGGEERLGSFGDQGTRGPSVRKQGVRDCGCCAREADICWGR